MTESEVFKTMVCKPTKEKISYRSSESLMTDLEEQKHTTRDMIRTYLYPSLAIFATGLATFSSIYFAIQIEPIAQQSRFFHHCLEELTAEPDAQLATNWKRVQICNGGN